MDFQIPLELISNLISVAILAALLYKYLQYKKKLDVLKGLDVLKNEKKLTSEDKEFIKKNLKDYKLAFENDEERIKIVYPVFILITGILFIYLSFQEAMIHLNLVVVAYIYLHISKLHNRNFYNFLKELSNNID